MKFTNGGIKIHPAASPACAARKPQKKILAGLRQSSCPFPRFKALREKNDYTLRPRCYETNCPQSSSSKSSQPTRGLANGGGGTKGRAV